MSNDSNPFTNLESTIDGLTRATDEHERRFYLRATLRGLCLVADHTHKALRALVSALKE